MFSLFVLMKHAVVRWKTLGLESEDSNPSVSSTMLPKHFLCPLKKDKRPILRRAQVSE